MDEEKKPEKKRLENKKLEDITTEDVNFAKEMNKQLAKKFQQCLDQARKLATT